MKQIKRVSFEEYEKSFHEALGETNNVIFYSFLDYEIEICFSWDNFIIYLTKSYKSIIEMYPQISDNELEDSDISLNDKFPQVNPEIIKFIKQYTHNRGILTDGR